MIKRCVKCGEMKEHQAKGLCYYCYKKYSWKPKVGICKRCGRERPLHSKGLCHGCYNFAFHLDRNKEWNHRKNYGLDTNTYKKIIEKCVVCGFDKVVDLHHLDQNKKNNSSENLIGLCPNHHKMIHNFRYKQEMFNILKEKGYSIKDDKKLDFNQQSSHI